MSSLTPRAALEVLRREHAPYVPQLVEVDDGGGWRDPTWDETAESLLEWWCDGCNRAADRCSVATVLALVDARPLWRRLLPGAAAGAPIPHQPCLRMERDLVTQPRITLFRGMSDWSALYVDGKLDRVGDHYLADERIHELCGIHVEYTDSFMRGQETRAGVAQTLDEINEYEQQRLTAEAKAAELRAQAEALLAEAKALDGAS